MNLRRVFCVFLVCFLCFSVVNMVPVFSSDKEGVLCIVKQGEEALLKLFKEEKESEGFKIFVISTDEIESSKIKEYMRKTRNEYRNLAYAIIPPDSQYGIVNYRGKKTFSDMYYCNLNDKDINVSGFKPPITVSRATAKMLSNPYKKFSKVKVTQGMPIAAFRHKIYTEACLYAEISICDFSRLGQHNVSLAMLNQWKIVSLYETLGIQPAFYKADKRLNAENFLFEFQDTTYMIMEGTAEPWVVDYKKKEIRRTVYEDAKTAFWKEDKNKDEYTTLDEIVVEKVIDFTELRSIVDPKYLNYKRIGYTTIAAMDLLHSFKREDKIADDYYFEDLFSSLIIQAPLFPFYSPPYVFDAFYGYEQSFDDGDGLKPSIGAAIRIMNDNLFSGLTVGKSLWHAFGQFNEQFLSDPSGEAWYCLYFIALGDPTATVNNILGNPEINLQPAFLNSNEISEIILDNNKEVEIIIQNIGNSQLEFQIYQEFSNLSIMDILYISPETGNIEPGQSVKVVLKFEIRTIGILSWEKNKFVILSIISNSVINQERRIRVRIL